MAYAEAAGNVGQGNTKLHQHPELQIEDDDGIKVIVNPKTGQRTMQLDGMCAIRKRKRTEAPPEQAAPTPAAAATPPAQASATSVAATGPVGTVDGPARSESVQHAEEQPPPAAAETPGEALPEQHDDEQPQAQLEDRSVTAMAVEDEQPSIAQAVNEQQPQEGAEQQQPPPKPPRKQDLKEVVAGLVKVIPKGCPTAVAVSWLMRETLRVTVPPCDEAAAAEAATFLERFQRGLDARVAAAKQLLLQGGHEQLQQFDRLPPMIRGVCEEERHAAALRRQLEVLEREEAAWMQLETKYGGGGGADWGLGGGDGGVDSPMSGDKVKAVDGEEDDMATAGGNQRVDVCALEAARQRAEMQVALQVEAIADMLDRAEALAAKAHRKSAELQAEHHKENFRPYAHVDSPLELVKKLSQSQLPTAAVDCVSASQS